MLRRIRAFKDHGLLLSGVLGKQPQVVLLMEYTIQNNNMRWRMFSTFSRQSITVINLAAVGGDPRPFLVHVRSNLPFSEHRSRWGTTRIRCRTVLVSLHLQRGMNMSYGPEISAPSFKSGQC